MSRTAPEATYASADWSQSVEESIVYRMKNSPELQRLADSISGLVAAITNLLPVTDNPHTRAKCRNKVEGYTVEKAAEGIARACSGILPSPNSLIHCP